MGFFTQMLTPAQLAQLAPPPQKGFLMTNADRALLSSLTTQLCDSLDALTDALRELRNELRASQTEPETWERATREHVLVPPSPPLLDPSL
jgi:hypothetical protein